MMKTKVWAFLLCALAVQAPADTLRPIISSPSQGGNQVGKPNRPYPDRPRPPPRPYPRPPHHHPVPPYYPYYPVYPSQTVVVQQPMEPVAIESLRVGDRMPPDYRYSDYAVDDYRGHGLNKPASHQRWALIAGQYYLYDLKSWQIKSIVRQ
ncbi:RcnB family protein [Vitreoscilla massiliensis]|uniref:RcnB family protein n=1 Tax=Vitreoscilla massiliensis TaxID=1689272 RepID=A0ABY4E5L5_9NEIS|nr:RcnB family protein [Vitreoscilla massiliensis]UOO91061.1 RcnB family protein [Vitreoscilla massiliensis]